MANVFKRKVFLSYATQDTEKVAPLRDVLSSNGFHIVSDSSPLKPGDRWDEIISYNLNTSDYLIVCLTKKLFKNGIFTFEYEKSFFEEARQRDIILIPVILEDVVIPVDFRQFQIFDLKEASGLSSLLKRMMSYEDVSFAHLTPKMFEEMTRALLEAYNFQNIKQQSKFGDSGVDFIAEYYSPDPFNRIRKDIYLIETKFYNQSRFNLTSVQNIVSRYKYIARPDAKLILITNSQLTSVVKEYLREVSTSDLVDITVIDGFALKQIIIGKDQIIDKFFRYAESGK